MSGTKEDKTAFWWRF